MFIELTPGTKTAPLAREGWTIPVQNTLPDVNPDEVYAALDADSRDYLKLLVDGAGKGLAGRGSDLQEVFARFEPTHRDLAAVTSKVAERQANLKRLVHSLNVLNTELATKDDDLAQLVDASATVFRAFASEEGNVSRAVKALPGALKQTTATLTKVEEFAKVLRPTVTELRPAVRKLDAANRAIGPFAEQTAPIVRDKIRPFVRDARPTVRELKTPAANLAKATPDLTRTFTVLNHLLNMAGFNRDGREDPAKGPARDEGFLFWLAWLNHNGASLFSSGDAHGPWRPVALGANCSIAKQVLETEGAGQLALLLAPVLMDPALCGSAP
jgi:phospholipid/cholesterol/gamma-HCH transport system substrate-binding protein